MNSDAFLDGYTALDKQAYVTRDVSVEDDNSEDMKTSETSHGQKETDDLEKDKIGNPDDSVHSKEAIFYNPYNPYDPISIMHGTNVYTKNPHKQKTETEEEKRKRILKQMLGPGGRKG
jgi:hypothetical protein